MYLAEANLEQAFKSGRRRVALEPNAVEAHNDLGDVYRKQNRDDEALVEFLVATLLDPLDGGGTPRSVKSTSPRARYRDATEALRRALTLEPDHAEARYALATALIRLGIDEEGKQQLEIAQRLQMERLEAVRRDYQVNLLRIEAALRTSEGRFDDAARLWQQVADREPNVLLPTSVWARRWARRGSTRLRSTRSSGPCSSPARRTFTATWRTHTGHSGVTRMPPGRAPVYEELKAQRLRARGAGR